MLTQALDSPVGLLDELFLQVVDVKVETVVDYGGCVVLYGGIIWRGIWRVCRFISDLLVCM